MSDHDRPGTEGIGPEAMKRLLLAQFHRHPTMTVQDAVKLLYQAWFGPRHFAGTPDPEVVRHFLEEELATMGQDGPTTLEAIGGGYVRIPLGAVRAGLLSAARLTDLFVRSMQSTSEPSATTREAYAGLLRRLLGWIEDGSVPFAVATSRDFLQHHLRDGIGPVHHSAAYVAAEDPHYRVVHASFLTETEVFSLSERVSVKNVVFPGIETNPSILGFGCMRLPVVTPGKPEIDEERAAAMIDFAYRHGVTYFDTAYPYHHGMSEPFVGKALARYPRASFFLATKMPGWLVHSRADAERLFREQLSRLGVTYFDYYLCHALGEENFKPYLLPGVMDFLLEMKRQGTIRHLGFSFHDTPETLEKILHAFPWDFVQLQLNYLDWTFQDARRQYELVRAAGLPVIVMEPVRGGLLANLPEDAAAVFHAAAPQASLASWALRYAASLPNVMVVLSGMSAADQVEDNVRTMSPFRPLTAAEKGVVAQAKDVFLKNRIVPCTACRYCMPCPHGVDIPRVFRVANDYFLSKRARDFIYAYEEIPAASRADRCVACGECLPKCPQKIAIPDRMKEIAQVVKDLKDAGGNGMRVIETRRERQPATRFIGLRYGDADRGANGGYGHKWGEWFEQGRFTPLEHLCLDTPEGRAYVGLMRCVPQFQYWIGVFCPAGTAVPAGYDSLDFPAMDVGVAFVKGREDNGEVYGAAPIDASFAAVRAAGITPVDPPWYWERYCEERFLRPDAKGEVILDYCIEARGHS